jgi:predicted dehydrogenase
MFDVAQHLVGRFDWVFCDAAHQTLADVEVEDTVHVTARAAMGQVLVSLALNQFMAPNETTLQINGDRASARIEFHSHRCAIQRLGETSWTTSEPLIRERDELFERQASLFLEGVAGARSILCPLEEGLHSLEINLAALKSAAEGTKVQVV